MTRTYIPVAIDRAVRERARGLCEYCRSPEDFNTDPFSIEHIYPVARGGSNDESNLALSCLGCNLVKGVRIDALDSVSGQTISLFHPRRDSWNDHFQWSKNFQEIEARTAVGRVTIIALDLNRRKLQNLRRALISIEEHPPLED